VLCAFANASRCINQHRKFNSFERSASHIENGSRIGREYCVISILLDRAKRARISLRIEKTQKETERVSIRSIRSTGRVIPTFAAFVCILRRGGKMKCIPAAVRAANSSSLSPPDRVFTQWVNTIETVERALHLSLAIVKFSRRNLRDSRSGQILPARNATYRE